MDPESRPVKQQPPDGADIEASRTLSRYLTNTEIQAFSWQDINVVVKDHKTKAPLSILTSSNGYVEAGEVLALMGPSGSGKTTLLNVLAHRTATTSAETSGRVMLDGNPVTSSELRQFSSYVEQEDALLGALTVRETIDFAARLALGSSISAAERRDRVDSLVQSFGLGRQAHTIVGTPLQKGISGGQKRRLGVASQLVTSPKILFLDEPTSGLDSTASREVMGYISEIAKQNRIIVIASIHQPSSETFFMFDRFLLLSAGKTCYFGPTQNTSAYFEHIGSPIPLQTNPAEYLLDRVNTDFLSDVPSGKGDVKAIYSAWITSSENAQLTNRLQEESRKAGETKRAPVQRSMNEGPRAAWILLRRNFIKSYRDLLTYGTRVVMYLGLAVMMGTVWLRLSYTQDSIQPFINAIFFGGAFMSFMAVAYIPSMVEDIQTLKKERANGLYGPFPFIVANFLIGAPYLFLIALLFSIVAYWLGNFWNTAEGFWMFVLWLFLDLLAAEGLVVLVTSIAPIFVVALAVTAFANGLWMSVGGFLVPMGTLNVFWKCEFSCRLRCQHLTG
jgi:ABC-type multidrug transport system ATPase subunit